MRVDSEGGGERQQTGAEKNDQRRERRKHAGAG